MQCTDLLLAYNVLIDGAKPLCMLLRSVFALYSAERGLSFRGQNRWILDDIRNDPLQPLFNTFRQFGATFFRLVRVFSTSLNNPSHGIVVYLGQSSNIG